MSGKLIIVSGYSGAGKSTLIQGAIKNIDNIEYLKTVVTRPPRDGEISSIEHDFVTDNEYENRHQAATMWDHVEYQGFKYGVDVDWVLKTLGSGTNLICAIAPEPGIYMKLKKLYGREPISIWIDTDDQISKSRISSDEIRSARQESNDLRKTFNHVFKPSGDIETDIESFVDLLKKVI